MKERIISRAKSETVFALNSVLAGLSISIGAIIFLQVTANSNGNLWLKALGALFFNLGLLSVIFFDFKLFTGMNADLINMRVREWYKLPICFIFNSVGIWIGALLIFKTPIGADLIANATAITNAKLSMRRDIAFVSSIMCGILITLAVIGFRRFRESSPVAGIIAVIFPIFVFVMIGVDHSVANQMYFALSCLGGNGFPSEIILHTFLVMLGNMIGGMLIPAIMKLNKYLSSSKKDSSK